MSINTGLSEPNELDKNKMDQTTAEKEEKKKLMNVKCETSLHQT